MIKQFRPALCALMLWPSMASSGFASDNTGSAARDESCDLVCRMQTYFNTDHMVTLVPASPQPSRTERRTAGGPSKLVPRRGSLAHAAPRKVFHAAIASPLPRGGSVATVQGGAARGVAPAVIAQRDTPAIVLQASPIIPGGAPLVTSQFAPPPTR